jgi:hypothetical protein
LSRQKAWLIGYWNESVCLKNNERFKQMDSPSDSTQPRATLRPAASADAQIMLPQLLQRVHDIGVLQGLWIGTLLDKQGDTTPNEETPMVQQRSFLLPSTASLNLRSAVRLAIGEEIRQIEGVELVCVKRVSDTFHVWTIIDKRNDDLEQEIYDAELRVMDRFEGIRFDFLIVHRLGRKMQDIQPTGTGLDLQAF